MSSTGPMRRRAARHLPGTVVMYGAQRPLEQAPHWQGLAPDAPSPFEPNGGSRSRTSQLGAIIDWQELLPGASKRLSFSCKRNSRPPRSDPGLERIPQNL